MKKMIFSLICIFSLFATLSFAMIDNKKDNKVSNISLEEDYIPLVSGSDDEEENDLFEEWKELIKGLTRNILVTFSKEVGLYQDNSSDKLKKEFEKSAKIFKKNMISYFDENVFDEISFEDKLAFVFDLRLVLESAFPCKFWNKQGSFFYLFLKKICLFFTDIRCLDLFAYELNFIPDFALEMKSLKKIKISFDKTVDKKLINKFILALKEKGIEMNIKVICEDSSEIKVEYQEENTGKKETETEEKEVFFDENDDNIGGI